MSVEISISSYRARIKHARRLALSVADEVEQMLLPAKITRRLLIVIGILEEMERASNGKIANDTYSYVERAPAEDGLGEELRR